MKLPKYYVISLFIFLLSKERQAKTEHMEMKISQPIFGILVALTKNEVTKICSLKICNEQGIRQFLYLSYLIFRLINSFELIWGLHNAPQVPYHQSKCIPIDKKESNINIDSETIIV